MSRRRRWRPLLEGPLRDRALEVVRDIAEALRDGHLDASGLHTGRAGIAVFFAYLARAGLLEDASAQALRFLDEAEADVEARAMDASLCEGFVGIAWAHAHVRLGLFGERDRGSLRDIDAVLATLVKRRPRAAEFELLYGLTGVGVYALERLPRRDARRLLRAIVERLAADAVPAGDDQVAWLTPPGRFAIAAGGEFNLGLAHGVPAVVGFLGRLAAAGVAPRTTRPLLAQAVRWLRAQARPSAGSAYPTYCDRTGARGPEARTAWCYGDPGVAAALMAAGHSARDRACQAQALELIRAAARRPPRGTRVDDAGLCHGAAGLGHVLNRFYQVTNDAALREAAVSWFRRTLAFRQPGRGIAGFTADDGADRSLLTGATGIGLALLAASTAVEPTWDRILLLDLPATGS